MGYSEGDSVVHPRHGLGTVKGTVKRGTGKNAQSYLEIFFEEKTLTTMVPVDSLEEVGIRPPATPEEAEVILEVLGADSDVPEAWAERNASTLSRVKSTELVQASMVIRDLIRHRQRIEKPLSASETSTLDGCMATVSLELSVSLGLSQDEAKELILSKVGVPDESVI